MIINVHLPQSFFESSYILWWLTCTLDDVTLDLLATILANIIDVAIIFKHLLPLIVCQAVAVEFQG